MAKLIFAMHLSLDGYVDDAGGNLVMPPPSDTLFQYWIDTVGAETGAIYGRRMYETMRYWDNDDPEWSDAFRAFAAAWQKQRKWVVSQTLTEVGPNASLITGDIEAQVRAIKDTVEGTVSVEGPQIAGLISQFGLIDEYHLYYRPFVLGTGKPFFHDALPRLRLLGAERLDDETMRLSYAKGE